jgi:hypothetical protein
VKRPVTAALIGTVAWVLQTVPSRLVAIHSGPPAENAKKPHREIRPHHGISSSYSLPSWVGQVQTEHPGKDKGAKHQA